MNKGLDEICEACGVCEGNLCVGLKKQAEQKFDFPDYFPESYGGLRFTSDAMDCSLPIAMDSHSGCSYNCLYCFSNNLQRAFDRSSIIKAKIEKQKTLYSQWPIRQLERFLARENKDKVSQAMYGLLDSGVPVQLGALGDPFDDLELHSGWAKKAIPLFIKYGVPVRVGTKGGIALQKSDYLKLFESSPDQFWFAFSIICNDDDLISQVDINAPVTSDRLKAMKALTDMGCNASIRFRPFLPGISDAYPGEPEAWKVLINRAAESGARAISFEYIFLSSTLTPRQKAMYQLMFRAMRDPKFGERWHGKSNQQEACRRASRSMKYEMTKKVREEVHRLGMTFGISDPHFKEWNDTGSCCGMPDFDHPWFSKWSRRQMTEVIVQARKAYENGKTRLFTYKDWQPHWAHEEQFTSMVSVGNWHSWRRKKYKSFGDHMRDKWNNPNTPRGPYKYFGKVLIPTGIDSRTGDVVYKYQPWTEQLEKGEVII